MAEASILSSKPKLKDINKYCDELDKKWYSLGIELEIDDKELDVLEEKYSDPHRRMIKMFGVWLDKGENPTYKKLIEALVNVGKRDVAESICTELGLTSSSESKSMNRSVSTAPSATSTFIRNNRESNQTENYASSYDTSTNDTENSRMQHHSSTTAPVDVPAYKRIIRCHDKLVTALSTNILTMSGLLLANEFIPVEISSKMLLPNSTPQEKATILVSAITDKMKIAPEQFGDLMTLFSKETCTKDIVNSLSSHVAERCVDNYQPGKRIPHYTPYMLQSQAQGDEGSSVQDLAHYQPVSGLSSMYGHPIPVPPSQSGGLQGLPNSSHRTQPLSQYPYNISNPVVHHTPYIHGNQTLPPPTLTLPAAHHPWQPTMHQASGLQSSTSATLGTMLQRDGGDVTSHKSITIEDVVNQAGIGLDALSEECSQTVLLDLAKYCVDWQLIGRRLGLTSADITAIKYDNHIEDTRRVGILEKWKERFSFRATYHEFIEALLSQGRTQDAVEACKVIGAASRH